MRLIDADELKKTLKSNCKPELCHDYNTAWCESCCRTNDFEDLIDNAPTVCGNNPKWCENCVSKGKCASTRPHIIDNCDMNVFEPEKYIEGGAE